MAVDHIELLELTHQPAKNDRPEWREVVVRQFLTPQRTWDARHQARAGYRIAGCEECDVMSARDELLGQDRDNAFGPTVARGRHTFERWRDLCDAHRWWLYADPA